MPIGITLALIGTAAAGGMFDGTYKGTLLVQPGSAGDNCHNNNKVTLIIKNNHFDQLWGMPT